MKRFHTLLFSLTLVSSYSVAKTGKIDAKYEANKKNGIVKSAWIKSSKLVNHKVESGDTLYSIARKHHATVARIELVNGIEKGDNLEIGRLLRVPQNSYTPDTKKSDITLASVMLEIDKEKRVQPEKAQKIKKIVSSEKISNKKPSTKKEVSKKKTEKETLSHIVEKGDTLYAIAKTNYTTVSALEKINHIKQGKSLKPGQVVALSETSKTPKLKTEVVKLETKAKKKTTPKIKVAELDTKTKAKKKTVSSKKTSPRKLVLEPEPTKKSFLASLRWKSNSSLKLTAAKKQLGKRYVWGATGPYTFDCSGFTSYVCKKNGVHIPRTSINQSKVGKRVNRNNLKVGDLVFFDTSKRRRGYINHVGIYMGNNKFIHASSAKKKVVITSLEKPFYKARFKWGSRVKG